MIITIKVNELKPGEINIDQSLNFNHDELFQRELGELVARFAPRDANLIIFKFEIINATKIINKLKID